METLSRIISKIKFLFKKHIRYENTNRAHLCEDVAPVMDTLPVIDEIEIKPIDTNVKYWYLALTLPYGYEVWSVAKSPLEWDEDMVKEQIMKTDNDVDYVTKCEILNEPAGHFAYDKVHYNFVTREDERNTIIDSILDS